MDINIKNIRALAQIMESAGLTAVEVSEGESKIRLEKQITINQISQAPNSHISKDEKLSDTANTAAPDDMVVNFNNIKEVKSPMVGVFYSAPSPGAEPFVKVGSKVKKGDTLCIIEAMKLMNEITAEFDGEIVDICAENGQVVEFSQVLFKIF